jgi:hypothetical protein
MFVDAIAAMTRGATTITTQQHLVQYYGAAVTFFAMKRIYLLLPLQIKLSSFLLN